MKIGIVCYPTFGGSGVVATELGKGLATKGHKVHFITYSQPVRLDFFSENLFYHEVLVSDYPLFEFSPYETALTSRLVQVAEYEHLDLLHVHYAIPHASVAYMAKQILASRGIRLPVVTTLHGTDITLVGKDPAYEPVVTFSINQSDGVTAVSKSLRDETYAHFTIEKKIEVIPNFVDTKRFSRKNQAACRSTFAPNNEMLIAHTSNFRKVKRVEDVIRVFSKIREKIPAKLLLVGDGPERSNIEKLCHEMDGCGDIRFLGKQETVEDVLSVCDLFILPSETESFGLAALEAMACQVPVISSNTGGIPELNIHGVTGYLSNVGDTNDMAVNALAILENQETLARFRSGALNQASQFSIEKILPRYETYYLNTVALLQDRL